MLHAVHKLGEHSLSFIAGCGGQALQANYSPRHATPLDWVFPQDNWPPIKSAPESQTAQFSAGENSFDHYLK